MGKDDVLQSLRDEQLRTGSLLDNQPVMSENGRDHVISGKAKNGETDIDPEPSVRDSEDLETAAQTTPPPPPPTRPLDDVPDGGLDAWLQVLGSWVIMINTWGLVNSYGVFQTYYETVMLPTQTSSAISWMGSLQAALVMLLGVVSGPLYDAGHLRLLIRVGLFLVVLGMFMTSLCTQYWQVLLAQGFCVGIGMGLTFLPSTAIISQYFRRHRALALGVASSGSPVVGMVFPIIFTRLERSVGFGWATRVIAFILLGLNVIPVVFMRMRTPPPPSKRPPPTTTQELAGATEKPRKGKAKKFLNPPDLRDAPYLLICLACFFAFLGLYVPFFYIQLYAQLHDVQPASFAPYLVTLLNAGSVVGRLLPNAVADRAGSLNVLLACTASSAILAYAWLGIGRSLGGLIAFALLYGGFSGGVLSVLPNCIMSLTPDLSRVGARMGVLFMLSGLSVLAGTPIAGAVLGGFREAEWKGMIGYSAASLTIASVLLTASRVVLFRKNGTAKQ